MDPFSPPPVMHENGCDWKCRSVLGDPVVRPLIVGSCGPQVEHGLGVGLFPPGAGHFKSFLDHVTVSTFYFTRTDGKIGGSGADVIQAIVPLGQVPMSGTYRSLLGFVGFQVGSQAPENLVALVVEQTALLASSPVALFVSSNDPGRRFSQVLTDMIEVQKI